MSDDIVTTVRFMVNWSGSRVGFSEVSGLNADVQVIEYREGADKIGLVRKLPGLTKYSNITLKRGISLSDNELYDWFKTVSAPSVQRRDITISLLNEEHSPIVSWKVRNAFPVKIKGPKFNAKTGEVAIEALELAHEGFVIEYS